MVPKFPNIPRLSVVVPYTGDSEAFETSLVSVLQHRPCSCEILVPHDGSYDDPFDLGDEVRFLDAGSRRLMPLIAAAAAAAHGRFVHVLSDGHAATAGWSDVALEMFEHHDAGIVVPVVRDQPSGPVAYAGWRAGKSAACELIGGGQSEVPAKAAAVVDGAFLSAGFFRRQLLRSLVGLYRGDDLLEASVVAGLAARTAGWRTIVAKSSNVIRDGGQANGATPDYALEIASNHRRLQAFVDQARGSGGWGQSLSRFIATAAGGYGVASALQRATAPLAETAVRQILSTAEVCRPEELGDTLTVSMGRPQPSRRAA